MYIPNNRCNIHIYIHVMYELDNIWTSVNQLAYKLHQPNLSMLWWPMVCTNVFVACAINGSTLIVNFSINLVTVFDALRYILVLCEKTKWMKRLYARMGTHKSLVLSNTLNILCIQTARDFDFTCLLPAVFGLVIKDVYSCWMIFLVYMQWQKCLLNFKSRE